MGALSEGIPPEFENRSGPHTAGHRSWRFFVRLPLAAAVVGGLAFYGYDRGVRTMGVNGTLTGPVYPVVAPIEGRVLSSDLALGSPVDAGATLLTLGNSVVDRQVLERMRRDLVAHRGEIEALEALERELDALREGLARDAANYQTSAVEQLRLRTHELAASLRQAEAEHRFAVADLARYRAMSELAVSERQIEKLVSAADAAAARVDVITAQRASALAELDAAERGIYTSTGYFETPYARQRLDEVALRLIDTRARLAQLRKELAHLETVVSREDARVRALARRSVDSPARAVVWSSFVEAGSTVLAGQTLARLARCDGLFVEVPVSESRLPRLARGMAVEVSLVGIDAPLNGSVTAIRGAGALTETDERAARPEARKRGMLTVAVAMDEAALAAAVGDSCPIGLTAHVRFPGGDLGSGMEAAWDGARGIVAAIGAAGEARWASLQASVGAWWSAHAAAMAEAAAARDPAMPPAVVRVQDGQAEP